MAQTESVVHAGAILRVQELVMTEDQWEANLENGCSIVIPTEHLKTMQIVYLAPEECLDFFAERTPQGRIIELGVGARGPYRISFQEVW